MRTRRRATTALFAVLAAGLAAPAMARAESVTVTGDDGVPIALSPAAPASIRNMDADLSVALGGTERAYALSVAGPVAAAASPRSCSSSAVPSSVDYQGNGTYTVTVTTFTNLACTTGAKTTVYQVAINAGVALTPPGGPVLTRQPNDFTAIDHRVPIALNPGALTHDIRVALGGVLAPDGSISGPSEQVFAESSTGTAGVRFAAPGTYLMVARATGFTGAAGQFFSPWSAPITIRALAPFDFEIGSPSFPDSRGPRYKLRAELREKSARGKVSIKLARGTRGKFRSIGEARLRRGVLKKRFTLHRTGVYRVKFTFKGSATTAPGTVTQKIRIRRRFF
jgi:uncharacterized membrane protein